MVGSSPLKAWSSCQSGWYRDPAGQKLPGISGLVICLVCGPGPGTRFTMLTQRCSAGCFSLSGVCCSQAWCAYLLLVMVLTASERSGSACLQVLEEHMITHPECCPSEQHHLMSGVGLVLNTSGYTSSRWAVKRDIFHRKPRDPYLHSRIVRIQPVPVGSDLQGISDRHLGTSNTRGIYLEMDNSGAFPKLPGQP